MNTINTEKRIKEYEETWKSRCYSDGIPDEIPSGLDREHLAPSWKRIAIALLKNDMAMQSLGYQAPQTEWYGALKRIELKRSGYVQLMLF